MARWLRFEQDGKLEFGTLDDGVIRIFEGDMFACLLYTSDAADE